MDIVAPDRRLLIGLIGAPIKHSASPAMHESAAAALGIRCHYQLMELEGADQPLLRQWLDGVKLAGFAGSNVTYPYKEAVVPLLDDLSPAARAIGAVNTIVHRDGRLTGYNTDATGLVRVLRAPVAAMGAAAVALIGAGGVGKAAGFALAELGVTDIRILDRDPQKAAALAAAVNAASPQSSPARVVDDIATAMAGAGGLVNGTPVGMWPSRASPVPTELLTGRMWVADAVYSPLWTPLLTAAADCGATVITGRELAIWQAVDAFRLFSGVDPSPEVMAAAFDFVIEHRKAA